MAEDSNSALVQLRAKHQKQETADSDVVEQGPVPVTCDITFWQKTFSLGTQVKRPAYSSSSQRHD
jgi:hypothetical protein